MLVYQTGRIDELQRTHQDERRDEAAKREAVAAAAEHSRPEPDHDHRQPHESRGDHDTQLREAVGGLVDQHTLDRRGHDGQEEKEMDARESDEHRTCLKTAVIRQD